MFDRKGALDAYRSVSVEGGVAAADPKQLITMLYDGALMQLARARGFMQQREPAAKGEAIGRAIDILGGLRGALDAEKGGEIAERLDALYDYMERRLTLANIENRVEMLDEVSNLLNEIRGAWQAIPVNAEKTG